MDLASLIRNVASRFNQPKKEKKQPVNPLFQDIANRFSSFISSQAKQQVQPINLPRVSQQDLDFIGKRFTGFMNDGGKMIQDVGGKFASYIGSQPLVPQLGKYSPSVGQGADFLADIPRNVARVGFEGAQTLTGDKNTYQFKTGLGRQLLDDRPLQNWTDPNRPGQQFAKNIGHPEFALPLVMAGVAADVTPFGMGKGKIVKEVGETVVQKAGLTAAQQAAKNKLSKIMFESAEEHAAKKWGITIGDMANFFKRSDAPTKAAKVIDNTPNASTEWKTAFKDWVNSRMSAPIQGVMKKTGFLELDEEGIGGIFKFQAGEKTGKFNEVSKFFADKLTELNKLGIDTAEKQNYLPQLWKNSEAEVMQKLGKTLGLRPSFTLRSVIDDYATGISLGLTPRFSKVSDLVGWYEQKASKAIADKKFFDYLKKTGSIMPDSQAPKWWSTVDPDKFPKETVKVGTNVITENWKAEEELARNINNYLSSPEGHVVEMAKVFTRVKTMALSGGVPNTSLNYFGFTQYVKSLLNANNPISQLVKSTDWFLRPNQAADFVQHNLDKAAFYVKHGLTLSTEDYGLIKTMQEAEYTGMDKVANAMFTKYEKMFSSRLFEKTLPAIKLNYTDEVFKNLSKSMPEDEAAKLAAETGNTMFGGINLDQLMRKKESQNLFRLLALAPDFLESNIRTGINVGKGLIHPTDPKFRAYRVLARNLVFFYATVNVINKAITGHWAIENPSGKKFEIDTNTFTEDGKKRYFRPFAGAVDWLRVPFDIVDGGVQGDPSQFFRAIGNRLSIPLGSATHLLTNTDYLGRSIYGRDKYGNPIDLKQSAGGIANELLSGAGLPVQTRAGLDVLSGRSNLEQGVMQALEVPMRYEGGAYSKSQKAKQETYKTAGLEGQELYDAMKFDKSTETEEKQTFFDGVLNFFGFGKEETKTESNDPLINAFNSEIAGDDKANRIRELFKTGLDKQGIEANLKKENLGTYEEASIYIMKALGVENGNRFKFIKEYTKDMTGEPLEKTLLMLAEEGVLTVSTISQAVDDELITTEEADYLRDLIKITKGTFKAKGAGKGKSSKLPTVKSGGSLPAIKAPDFSNQGYTFKEPSYRPTQALKPVSLNLKPLRVSRAPEPSTKFGSYK